MVEQTVKEMSRMFAKQVIDFARPVYACCFHASRKEKFHRKNKVFDGTCSWKEWSPSLKTPP